MCYPRQQNICFIESRAPLRIRLTETRRSSVPAGGVHTRVGHQTVVGEERAMVVTPIPNGDMDGKSLQSRALRDQSEWKIKRAPPVRSQA
jgi:hypothetical protein